MEFRERASVVCVAAGRLLAVRLRDPATGLTAAYLPGGALEPGEAAAAAAGRETLEETGYAVRVDPARVRRLRYSFVWGGVTYDCLTHFFPATLVDGRPPALVTDDPALNRGVEWVELAAVPERFGYHAGILSEILALI
jgi:tRNA(adenine34) deaminase